MQEKAQSCLRCQRALRQTEAACAAWASVANAIVDFEPVTVLVGPGDHEAVRRLLAEGVQIVPATMDDAWPRDTGPTFVLDEQGRLGGVEWTFNGWGQQVWCTWEKDKELGRLVTDLTGAHAIPSKLVNEGGGIHNGAVIACGYQDPQDDQAREILAEAYPDREIVMLDARPILARGRGRVGPGRPYATGAK